MLACISEHRSWHTNDVIESSVLVRVAQGEGKLRERESRELTDREESEEESSRRRMDRRKGKVFFVFQPFHVWGEWKEGHFTYKWKSAKLTWSGSDWLDTTHDNTEQVEVSFCKAANHNCGQDGGESQAKHQVDKVAANKLNLNDPWPLHKLCGVSPHWHANAPDQEVRPSLGFNR